MTDDAPVLYFDTETYCATPIKDGVHRYAEGVEIMIAAWALDDPLFGEGEIVVEDITETGAPSSELLGHLQDPSVRVVIHNAGFDRTVVRHAWGIDIPLDRIECTMARAQAHGLPGGLGHLSAIFKLGDDAKDAGGGNLIQLFCKPAPKNSKIDRRTRFTHPEEWERFLRYAGGDIRAMRILRRKLPNWNYPGKRTDGRPNDYDVWLHNEKINERGFRVDTKLAEEAVDMVARLKKTADARVQEMTDEQVQTLQQRDAMLKHLLERYGVTLPDMAKSTLERRIDDPNLPEPVRELLMLRLDQAMSSTTKYKALLRSVSSDGRLRGTLAYCGAARTGRKAGRLFQPQNLIRPNKAEAEAMHGWAEDISGGAGDLLLDNPNRAAAVCLRAAIVASPGKKLVCADLSNIEGRMLAWLAGEDWKLKAFAEFDAGRGHDLYRLSYAQALRKKPDDVTDDERQIGKVLELACGFQGAAGAFGTMAALYGLELPEEQVKAVVEYWRDANANIRQFWYDLDEAAREATLSPGRTVQVGEHIAFNRWREWLRLRLPSGRLLCYCQPALVPHPKFAGRMSMSYLGVNSYTRKWERIHTYGGKFCIAEDTPVLTRRGWVPIQTVTANDKVWDGDAWVRTGGAIDNGAMEVIKAFGGWMTADHGVLTEKGWLRASQGEGHNRAACRLPDSHPLCRIEWSQELVGGEMRLRCDSDLGGHRAVETKITRDRGVVRLQTPGDDRSPQHQARHVAAPGLRGMGVDDCPLLQAVARRVSQLRRAWDKGLRTLARQFRGFLDRHGANLHQRAYAGSGGQQRPLRAGQLPLGHAQAAGQQHPFQQVDRHLRGPYDGRGVFGTDRHRPDDAALPHVGRRPGRPAGGSARCVSQVYDLMDCGPRNRFVIATEGGPLIVHNCENATQAAARDVLVYNMLDIEAAGYPVILDVHDDVTTEPPDDPRYTSDRLCAMLASTPWWADDRLPLAAAGFETYRWKKV